MVYIRSFQLPSVSEETNFLSRDGETKRTCYTSRYPFGIFLSREVPRLQFEPITILCGGNGSGKTTILNLIGEKLGLHRGAVFNRSAFFGRYLDLCQAETAPAFDRAVKEASRVITSDDVFDYLLDLRGLNEGIDRRRRELLEEYAEARYASFQMRSLADVDRLRQVTDAQRKTGSRYVRDRVMNDVPGQSNGESAFLFFTRQIGEGGLYLLDEPENSLSPQLVCSVRHSGSHHGIADQADPFFPEHFKSSPDHGRMNVITIADQFCHTVLCIQSGAYHTRISVGKGRHGVEEMGHMGGTGIHGCFCTVIIGGSMSKRNHDFVFQLPDKIHCSFFLW